MAKVKMTGFDELEKMFSILGDQTKMAIKAVDEAAPIVERHLKLAITTAAEHPTGDLAGHIETTKARENEYGVFAVVKPTDGSDQNGIPYTERMRWFDVGHRDVNGKWHHGKGVRQRAVNAARAECEKVMEKHLDQFVKEAAQ